MIAVLKIAVGHRPKSEQISTLGPANYRTAIWSAHFVTFRLDVRASKIIATNADQVSEVQTSIEN